MLFEEYIREKPFAGTTNDDFIEKYLRDSEKSDYFTKKAIETYIKSNENYSKLDGSALQSLWKGYVRKDNQVNARFGAATKSINVPIPIREKIEQFKEANDYTTFTQAIIKLVEIGLKESERL